MRRLKSNFDHDTWNLYIFTPTQNRIHGKHGQIHNELINKHHSTRNLSLIPNSKSKIIFDLCSQEKIVFDQIFTFLNYLKFQFEIYPYVIELQIICSRIANVLKIELIRVNSRTCGYFLMLIKMKTKFLWFDHLWGTLSIDKLGTIFTDISTHALCERLKVLEKG